MAGRRQSIASRRYPNKPTEETSFVDMHMGWVLNYEYAESTPEAERLPETYRFDWLLNNGTVDTGICHQAIPTEPHTPT